MTFVLRKSLKRLYKDVVQINSASPVVVTKEVIFILTLITTNVTRHILLIILSFDNQSSTFIVM